ncbi:AAA family ATPase [uncultured Porphyromonas sp.]|jgi:hypothetical protein|uniref:AAA family ATPase n=1 Tax=uncultured Porphyromonas sp. TaxID=159274 RepID=UPI00261F0B5D|nr:AAA family ATPase [uncultured Porphyromonas sp.]
MSTIQIQHIGALKDTGELPIKRVTLFLGPQGAGKSTLMKILCYCRWVEKEIMKDLKNKDWYTHYKRFFKGLSEFHRLPQSFFSSDSSIVYKGDLVAIIWSLGKNKGNAKVSVSKSDFARRRHNPKLAFIPAERNLVSAVQNIDRNYRSNSRDVLFNFILELEEAKQAYTIDNKLALSIMPGLSYYQSEGTNLIWHEEGQYVLNAFYVASGIQSAFPVDVISSYLHTQVGRLSPMSMSELSAVLLGLLSTGEKLPDDISDRLSRLEKSFLYSSMQLYIEEPEQNLFPESQRRLMFRLLQIISSVKEMEKKAWAEPYASSLVFTTHSPYLLSVINTQFAVARARLDLKENSEGFSEKEQERRLAELDALQQKHRLDDINLTIDEYAAYFVEPGGTLKNLIDPEFPMVSGVELDGVSDWVEDYTNEIYLIAYGSAD